MDGLLVMDTEQAVLEQVSTTGLSSALKDEPAEDAEEDAQEHCSGHAHRTSSYAWNKTWFESAVAWTAFL